MGTKSTNPQNGKFRNGTGDDGDSPVDGRRGQCGAAAMATLKRRAWAKGDVGYRSVGETPPAIYLDCAIYLHEGQVYGMLSINNLFSPFVIQDDPPSGAAAEMYNKSTKAMVHVLLEPPPVIIPFRAKAIVSHPAHELFDLKKLGQDLKYLTTDQRKKYYAILPKPVLYTECVIVDDDDEDYKSPPPPKNTKNMAGSSSSSCA